MNTRLKLRRMINKIFFLPVAIGIFAFFIYACSEDYVKPSAKSVKTEEEVVQETTIEEVEEDVAVESVLDDIFERVLDDFDDLFLKSSECPVITVTFPDSTKFPRVVTRDFGESCINTWGKEKSGKVIITYMTKPKLEGSVRILNFEDYSVNGISISGEKKIVYKGVTEEGYLHFTVKGVIDLVKKNGVVVKRKINKNRYKIAGIDPSLDETPEWLVTGKVKVKKSNGLHYHMTIVEPIHRIKSCKYIVEGIKEINVLQTGDSKLDELIEKGNGKIDIVIDYGDGECDNIATKSINGGDPEKIELK